VNVAVLAWLLIRRRHLVLDRRLRRRIPRLLAAAMAMALVLLAAQALIFPHAGGLARFAGLAALIGAGLAAYFGTAQALGGLDLREALRTLRRR